VATEAVTSEATSEATEEATEVATEEATSEATSTADATIVATGTVTSTDTVTATGTATSTAAMTPTTEVSISVSTSSLGQILTGENGRTIYIFTQDTDETSTCYDSCARNWPPVLSLGTPQAGNDVDDQLLGTTTRSDGTTQVTYNGMPVYYFAGDQAAGDTNGQGIGNVWYVLSPAGERIEN
jgi:predicted lipoprotein with Yx(FWY)xxD motif